MRLRFKTRMLTVFGISVLLLFSFTAMNMAIFSGKYETGGKSYPGYGYGGLGIYGQTKAYSTMELGQGKANTFAIYKADSYGRQDAEAGWWWKKSDSNAPLHYVCGYINGRPTQTNVTWFTPGSTPNYQIQYCCKSGSNYKWTVYTVGLKRYVYTTINSGNMMLIGEEINCANSCEFWDLHMLTHYRDPDLLRWDNLNNPVNWINWDTDPGYRFLGGRPYGSNSGQIVPGGGPIDW